VQARVVLEGAVAVAQQHADSVAEQVGDDEVGLAVAVEVRHRYRDCKNKGRARVT
jgi:hypothetical protein